MPTRARPHDPEWPESYDQAILTVSFSPAGPQRPRGARCSGPKLCLRMPVDSLTRLMMDADGVSVSEMEALMRRISRTLSERPSSDVSVSV